MPIDVSKEEIYTALGKGVESALKEFRKEYLPSRLLTELLATCREEKVELFISAYPETSSLLLEELAASTKNIQVLANIAAHPRTAAKVMQALASHHDDLVRLMLAGNKQISPQTAAILGEDKSVFVKITLAGNSALPSRIRVHLQTDPSPLVRAIFSDVKNIEKESANKLLMDPDYLVKARTAILAKVTDDLLLKWADSDELFVQLFLLCRLNLPPKVIESLSFSSHKEVQILALSKKILAEDEQLGWANSEDKDLRKVVAGKKEITEKVQKILATDLDLEVRATLAMNPSLTTAGQNILAKEPKGEVGKNLLARERLPEEILTKVCENCDETQAFELVLTMELSSQQVVILASRFGLDLIFALEKNGHKSDMLMREKAVELINSRIPTLMAFALRSQFLKTTELIKFVMHPCANIRLALLENKNVSQEILLQLQNDEVKEISRQATELLTTSNF